MWLFNIVHTLINQTSKVLVNVFLKWEFFLLGKIFMLKIRTKCSTVISLFRNMRFMLEEMPWNDSKFATFLKYHFEVPLFSIYTYSYIFLRSDILIYLLCKCAYIWNLNPRKICFFDLDINAEEIKSICTPRGL